MKKLKEKLVAVKPKKGERTSERNLKSNIITLHKRYANIKEVSEYTSIPVKTLYHWTNKKIIPYIKIERRIIFDLQDIDKLMVSLKQKKVQAEGIVNKIVGDVQESKYNTSNSGLTDTKSTGKEGEDV
jgi:hypothetical protein